VTAISNYEQRAVSWAGSKVKLSEALSNRASADHAFNHHQSGVQAGRRTTFMNAPAIKRAAARIDHQILLRD